MEVMTVWPRAATAKSRSVKSRAQARLWPERGTAARMCLRKVPARLELPRVPAYAGAAKRGSQLEGGLVWGRSEIPGFCGVGPRTQAGSLNTSVNLSFEGRVSASFLRPDHIPSKSPSRERPQGCVYLVPWVVSWNVPVEVSARLPLWPWL